MRWTQTESESPDVFMKCWGLADDIVARVLIGVLDRYNLISESIVADVGQIWFVHRYRPEAM